MIRIFELPISDLLFDPAASSQLLTKSCAIRNRCAWRVTGLMVLNECLYLPLESLPAENSPCFYRFAPLGSGSFDPDAATAEIVARYAHGYRTCGTFELAKQLWALFERTSLGKEEPLC